MTLGIAGHAQELPPASGVPSPLPGTPVAITYAAPTIAWTKQIPAAPVVSPIVTADRVIAAHLPGVVVGYSREDGRDLWRVELAPGGPLATDGSLLFVPAVDAIHALRASDGSLAWRSPSAPVTAPLVVREGWLIAATEGQLSARRAGDGSIVWTVDAAVRPEGAAIAGDVLFLAEAGARLVARDLADGRVRWARRLGGDPGAPLVVGDDVFVGASDRKFYCVDALTGEIKWPMRVGASVRGSAASDGYRIFFGALDNLIRALDRSNGAMRWHKGVPFRPTAGPFVAGGTVFVAGPGSELRAFNTSNGAEAGTITFPGRQAAPPGFLAMESAAVFAAVTGSLAESWNLTLTRPIPVTPASR